MRVKNIFLFKFLKKGTLDNKVKIKLDKFELNIHLFNSIIITNFEICIIMKKHIFGYCAQAYKFHGACYYFLLI